MKKQLSRLTIIVMVTVLVMAFLSCGGPINPDDPGVSSAKIGTRITFTGEEKSAVSQSIRAAHDISFLSDNLDADSFSPFTTMYSKLGNHVRNITPTKMEFSVAQLALFGEKGMINLAGTGGGEPIAITDFAKSVTISPGDIQPGKYEFLRVLFCTYPYRDEEGVFHDPFISFPWPLANDVNHYITSPISGYGTSLESGILTTRTVTLDPGYINNTGYNGWSAGIPAYGLTGDASVKDSETGALLSGITDLFFAGDTRKAIMTNFNGRGGTVYMDEIMPASFLSHIDGERMPIVTSTSTQYSTTVIVTPFNGITIPENAKTVNFTVGWDINGIIGQFAGPDQTNDTGDDVFVIKNNFWDALYVNASIGY